MIEFIAAFSGIVFGYFILALIMALYDSPEDRFVSFLSGAIFDGALVLTAVYFAAPTQLLGTFLTAKYGLIACTDLELFLFHQLDEDEL